MGKKIFRYRIQFAALATAGILLAGVNATAATYYVATNGNDSNAGNKDKPFATLKKANAVVTAGDTVWIRGGTYNIQDTTYVSNDKMSAGNSLLGGPLLAYLGVIPTMHP